MTVNSVGITQSRKRASVTRIEASFSVGLRLKKDGTITDTIRRDASCQGRDWAGNENCRQSTAASTPMTCSAMLLKATKNNSAPFELLVENTDYYKIYKLDYHGGEMYPHLVRDESKPDVLGAIIKAR